MFNFPPYLRIPINLFSQKIYLLKRKQGISGYLPEETTTEKIEIKAVVQPQKPTSLKIDIVDISLEYLLIHSVTKFDLNDQIEYKSTKYRIIQISAWGDYGYNRCVAEELK